MLGVKTYEESYIDRCRTALAAQLAAYNKMIRGARQGPSVQEFERRFLANLVIVLDAYFVHRLRGVEGKDGNPLNEVRMLADSILRNEGVLTASTTIKYRVATSVLGYEIGQTIAPDRKGFARLADRYFDEMQRRFT